MDTEDIRDLNEATISNDQSDLDNQVETILPDDSPDVNAIKSEVDTILNSQDTVEEANEIDECLPEIQNDSLAYDVPSDRKPTVDEPVTQEKEKTGEDILSEVPETKSNALLEDDDDTKINNRDSIEDRIPEVENVLDEAPPFLESDEIENTLPVEESSTDSVGKVPVSEGNLNSSVGDSFLESSVINELNPSEKQEHITSVGNDEQIHEILENTNALITSEEPSHDEADAKTIELEKQSKIPIDASHQFQASESEIFEPQQGHTHEVVDDVSENLSKENENVEEIASSSFQPENTDTTLIEKAEPVETISEKADFSAVDSVEDQLDESINEKEEVSESQPTEIVDTQIGVESPEKQNVTSAKVLDSDKSLLEPNVDDVVEYMKLGDKKENLSSPNASSSVPSEVVPQEKPVSSIEDHEEKIGETIKLQVKDTEETSEQASNSLIQEDIFENVESNEKMPWEDSFNKNNDNSQQEVDHLFGESNQTEKLPWEQEEEIDQSIEYEQLEGGEVMPWEEHEAQFNQLVESNDVASPRDTPTDWTESEKEFNSTSVYHPTPVQNRNSTIALLSDGDDDDEKEGGEGKGEGNHDKSLLVPESKKNEDNGETTKKESTENESTDNFGFLEEDNELLLDDIMDDDFLDDDDDNEEVGGVQSQPEGGISNFATPVANKYQPAVVNKYQPAQVVSAETAPTALYSPSTNVTIPVPGANLFSPAQPLPNPGGIAVANPTTKKLAERKKKTDAYDFPVSILAKSQPPKVAAPPQDNIYTRIESGSLHSTPQPLPNVISQENNNMPPPASTGPRTLKPKSSFFNELPMPVKQKTSSLHLRNPYEAIEKSPALAHAILTDNAIKNVNPSPSPKNPYAPLSPVSVPKNPYAPISQPSVGLNSPITDAFSAGGAQSGLQQQFPQSSNANMYRPVGMGINGPGSVPPQPINNLYAPTQSPQPQQPNQPSYMPQNPLHQNNPYVPANNGHARTVSNVSTGSITSPVGQGNPMLHNPINKSVFQPASASTVAQGANRFNPARLSMSNEQRPVQPLVAGNSANKYAPYNPSQQMYQPQQGQQMQALQHQQLQPQIHHLHHQQQQQQQQQQLQLQVPSQRLDNVYGQKHQNDLVTSPKVHNRKNSHLLPPSKGGNRTVPPNMTKSMQPAPVVINPENLVLKQWPTFSWSGLTNVAKSIPSNDAYGNHKSVLYVVDSSTILTDEKKLISSFPGPLSKSKTKRKDLDKWLTDKLSTVGINSPNDPITNSQQLIWSILKVMINEIHTSSDLKKPSYKKQIVELFQPGIRLSDGFLESNQFTSVSTFALSQLQNNNKQFNAHKLDQSGLMRLYSNLQEGNKQAALELAISENDWAVAFLVANLIGRSCFVEVLSLYSQYNLDQNNPIQKNLAFFLTSIESDFSSNKFVGKEKLFIENFNAFIPFTLLNNPQPESILIYLSKLFTDSGYYDYGLIAKLLSGFPVYDQSSISNSSASIDSMIVEEIYEFILQSSSASNTNVPSSSCGFPHTLPIKINHAGILADYGHLTEAKKYLEFIDSVMKGKPFYITRECFISHQRLADRLSVSGSNSSGWFTGKKIWGQLDKSFNKFVSGEDVTTVESPAKTEGVFSNFSPALNESRSSIDLPRFNASQSMSGKPQSGIPPQLRPTMSHSALSYGTPKSTTFTPGYQQQEIKPLSGSTNPYGIAEDRNLSATNLSGMMAPLQPSPMNPATLQRRATNQSGTAINRYAPYAPPAQQQPQQPTNYPVENAPVSPKRPQVKTANSSTMSSPLQMAIGLSHQESNNTIASPAIVSAKKPPSKYAPPTISAFDTPTPAAKLNEQIASKKSFQDLTAALNKQLESDIDAVEINEDPYTPPETLEEVTEKSVIETSPLVTDASSKVDLSNDTPLPEPSIVENNNVGNKESTVSSPAIKPSDFAQPPSNPYSASASRGASPGPPSNPYAPSSSRDASPGPVGGSNVRNPYAPTTRNSSVSRANPYAPKITPSGLHHSTNHYAPVNSNTNDTKEESLEDKYNSSEADNYSNVAGSSGANVSSFDYYSYGGYHSPAVDNQTTIDEKIEEDHNDNSNGEENKPQEFKGGETVDYKVDDLEEKVSIEDSDLPPPSGHMFVPAGNSNAFSQPIYNKSLEVEEKNETGNKSIVNDEDLYNDDYDDDVVEDEDDDEEEDSYAIAQRKKREEREREERRKQEEKEAKERQKKKEEEEAKKNGGESGWFGWLANGKKKDDGKPKPIKAKLGEQSSFYFDEKIGKWINKNAPIDEQLNSNSAPPPPSLKPKKSMANIPESTPTPSRLSSISGPPSSVQSSRSPSVSSVPIAAGSTPSPAPPSSSSISGGPPSTASIGARRKPKIDNSIDDLLNISASPSVGGKKKRGPRRGYVDVMAQDK